MIGQGLLDLNLRDAVEARTSKEPIDPASRYVQAGQRTFSRSGSLAPLLSDCPGASAGRAPGENSSCPNGRGGRGRGLNQQFVARSGRFAMFCHHHLATSWSPSALAPQAKKLEEAQRAQKSAQAGEGDLAEGSGICGCLRIFERLSLFLRKACNRTIIIHCNW